MDELRRNFGEAIKSQRAKMDLSQEKLAELAGLHRTYISDVERGARNPSLGSIEKLARALQVPIAELFRGKLKKCADENLVEILLVEDMPQDVELTLRALKHANITNRIHVVRDGAAALNFLFCTGEYAYRQGQEQPQLILLDLGLPKVDGLEVLQRIKADPRTRPFPVIVLSASTHDRDLATSQRLGADGYIVKPVDFQNLSEVIPQLSLQWALLRPVQ
ncbi:MAG: response regulator [Verrucomicrobiota bacterium]